MTETPEVSGSKYGPDTSILIIGYGNVDRQDDGVAWHVLYRVAAGLGCPLPAETGESFPEGSSPEFLFILQLTPELAETIRGYAKVCFVDAHTGAVPQDLQAIRLDPGFQASPFTHHLTPNSLLALSQALYGSAPDAWLVSVRGYEFGFSHSLSPVTDRLADSAAEWISAWLHNPDTPLEFPAPG